MYDFTIPGDYRRYLIDNITRILPTLSDYQLSVLLDDCRFCQTHVPKFSVTLSNSKFKKNDETQKIKTKK